MSKSTRNIAASIRQRLKNRSIQDKRPFAELLQYYAMERFLYRLTQSEHADRFVLKGALMLRAWKSPEFRPTMDIDMLGKTTSNEVEHICVQVRDIISIAAYDDGLIFDPTTIRGVKIKEDADYEGVRVRFIGKLENARVTMQLDVGFGDIVHPSPEEAELPTLLDSPAPRLLCYSRESVIAEKFEAMVKLGDLNSRMKDFFDIWLLSRQFEFDGDQLRVALQLTLSNRGTEIPKTITAFTKAFVKRKNGQWGSFHKRLGQDYVPADFSEVVLGIEAFLNPVVTALSTNHHFTGKWSASGCWVK